MTTAILIYAIVITLIAGVLANHSYKTFKDNLELKLLLQKATNHLLLLKAMFEDLEEDYERLEKLVDSNMSSGPTVHKVKISSPEEFENFMRSMSTMMKGEQPKENLESVDVKAKLIGDRVKLYDFSNAIVEETGDFLNHAYAEKEAIVIKKDLKYNAKDKQGNPIVCDLLIVFPDKTKVYTLSQSVKLI